MTLYKFMEPQYADDLLTRGSIRIGTIFDFRDSRHELGVRDESEGKKILSSFIGTETVTHESMPGWMRSGGFLDIHGGGAVRLQNCTFVNSVECLDHYVLCLTLSKDAGAGAMGLPYGACVEIMNPKRFFQRISMEMLARLRARYRGSYDVEYSCRTRSHAGDNGRFPGLIKPMEYSEQQEHRALWEPPIGVSIKPEIIEVPSLGRFCRLI